MHTRESCRTHAHVDKAETRAYGGVVVHMVEPWHVARTGAVIEMAGAEPVLENGMPVVRYDETQLPLDAEPPSAGVGND